MPIITTLMPLFATSRAKVEHSIFFMEIRESKVNNLFPRRQYQRFDCGSVKIKSEKTLYLSVWENFFVYRNKCPCLASEKFVLASEFWLATGLAS